MHKGGARPGAGRPRKPKIPFVPRCEAVSPLDMLGLDYKGRMLPTERELWLGLLLSPDLRMRLEALKYLTDRRDGKARERVEHSGREDAPIKIISFVPRPGDAGEEWVEQENGNSNLPVTDGRDPFSDL